MFAHNINNTSPADMQNGRSIQSSSSSSFSPSAWSKEDFSASGYASPLVTGTPPYLTSQLQDSSYGHTGVTPGWNSSDINEVRVNTSPSQIRGHVEQTCHHGGGSITSQNLFTLDASQSAPQAWQSSSHQTHGQQHLDRPNTLQNSICLNCGCHTPQYTQIGGAPALLSPVSAGSFAPTPRLEKILPVTGANTDTYHSPGSISWSSLKESTPPGYKLVLVPEQQTQTALHRERLEVYTPAQSQTVHMAQGNFHRPPPSTSYMEQNLPRASYTLNPRGGCHQNHACGHPTAQSGPTLAPVSQFNSGHEPERMVVMYVRNPE